MVQKKKISKSTSVKRKSPSTSSSKRKLGKASLDWITDTTEGEEVLSEQAESSKNKPDGKLKEKKIGVLKQYVSEEVEKKKDEEPEEIPAILGSSSTIIKGKGITPAKKEEAQKTEVIEIEEDKEKTISAEETPVEIVKTHKVTEKKKLVLAEEEEKTVSAKKETVPDEKKTSPEYEVKKEDVTTKEEISKEPSVRIPEDSSSIVKKRKETVAKEEETKEKEKPSAEEEKIAAAAAKEEVPSSAERKWMKISGIGGALKKGGKKVSGAVVKPLESDKTKLRKSVSSVINVSKQPVKAISAIDHKITQSMRSFLSDIGNVEKSILKNIKLADTKITKSAKKVINSILD